MIKLIAIDLDGTLLNNQKEITPYNKEVLQKAKAQGVKVVLCTGRPLRAIRPYLEELGLKDAGDYSITFNGGLVQKNDTGEILDKSALELSDIKRLIQMAQDLDLPLDVVSDEVVYVLPTSEENNSIYGSLNPLLDCHPITEEELAPDGLYNKAVVAFEQTFLDQQIAKIPQDIRDDYEVIKTREVLLEFMPKGVTKAYGCQLLGEHLGIKPEEMMAIGDEENDLPMIEFAGVGVAMDNAVPAVKSAANVLTASNEEDGVGKVVAEYLK